MYPLKRLLSSCLLLIGLAVAGGFSSTARAEAEAAPAAAQRLCDALLGAMKAGTSLDFAGRRDLLAPEIQRDFDLAFMIRIIVGPPWRSLTPGDQQKLADAFSAYSIATYAQRFHAWSGEHFAVDPSPTALPRGDCVVHTKLFTGDPTPVQLDYLMRKTGDRWRIIDVYLNGTISEVAARRSEYTTILRQGGAPALIALLAGKTEDFARQRPGSS